MKLFRRLVFAIVPAIVMFSCGAFSPFVAPAGRLDTGTRALVAVIGATVLLLAWRAILFRLRAPEDDRRTAPSGAAGRLRNLLRPRRPATGAGGSRPGDPPAGPPMVPTVPPVVHPGPDRSHPADPAGSAPARRNRPGGAGGTASTTRRGRAPSPVRQPAHPRARDEDAYRRNDAKHRNTPAPHEPGAAFRNRHEPRPEVRARSRQD